MRREFLSDRAAKPRCIVLFASDLLLRFGRTVVFESNMVIRPINENVYKYLKEASITNMPGTTINEILLILAPGMVCESFFAAL